MNGKEDEIQEVGVYTLEKNEDPRRVLGIELCCLYLLTQTLELP